MSANKPTSIFQKKLNELKKTQIEKAAELLQDGKSPQDVAEKLNISVKNLAVLLMLKELIAREDKTCPLSDQALADRLQKQGVALARRTVAKYRESLGIPGTAQRRR